MSHYSRLSALDRSFLDIENRNTPMHVGATCLLDVGPLQASDGGVDIERVRAYVESRLHLIPRYRQHLARIPIEGHPVWVDDDQFDIRYRDLHDLVLLIRQSFDELCEAAGLFPEEVPALPAIEKNCAEAGDAMGA